MRMESRGKSRKGTASQKALTTQEQGISVVQRKMRIQNGGTSIDPPKNGRICDTHSYGTTSYAVQDQGIRPQIKARSTRNEKSENFTNLSN